LNDKVESLLQRQYPQGGEKVRNELQKILAKVEISRLSGVLGYREVVRGLALTPKDVVNVNSHDWGFRLRQYVEFGEVVVKPNKHTVLLFDDSIARGLPSAGSKVLLTTLVFPDGCCECGLPTNHVAFVETNVRRYHSPLKGGGRIKFSSKRVKRAFMDERIWFPLPLCSNHKDWRISVRILGKGKYIGGKILLRFANQSYGKRFASANDLPYLHVTPLIAAKRFMSGLGIWIAVLGGIFSALTSLSSSGDLLQYQPFRKALIMLLVGLAMMALGLFKEKPQKVS
jgi:hypothetical protein